jgi:Ca2+-binding RTX toxin-like protein
MAFSLGELFPLRGSRRAAALARAHSAKTPASRRAKAAARPSALAFETFEPRMLLSADVLNNVTIADYVANPTIGSAVLGDLTTAINLLDNVASAAQGDDVLDPLLDSAIPGLLEREDLRGGGSITQAKDYYAPTLRDVLANNGADPVNFSHFLNETLSGLTFFAGGTATSLNTALGGLSWNEGAVTVTIDSGTFQLVNTSGSNYEYRFDLDLIIEILDTSDKAHLDLGRNADGVELAYGADVYPGNLATTPVTLKSTYRVDALVVAKASIVQDTYDHDGDGGEENPTPELPRVTITAQGGVVRNPTFAAGVSADTTLPAFSGTANAYVTFGFLDVSAGAADIDLLMAAEADFSGDFASNAALVAYDLTGHVEEAANSHVTISLPISVVDIPGYAAFADSIDDAAATVVLSAPQPFDDVFQPIPPTPDPNDKEDPRTALQVKLQDFEELEPFRNLDAAALANVVNGLANMLEQLQTKAELFGASIPFLDGKKISNLLDFDGPVKDLFDAITKEENGVLVAEFTTVQGFVDKLAAALASFGVTVSNIAPTFTTDRASGIPTLLFKMTFTPAAANQSLAVDGDLGVDLGPLGDLAVSGSLDVETTLRIDVTLGIELSDEPLVSVSSVAGPFAVTALTAPTSFTIGGSGADLRILVGGHSAADDDDDGLLEGGGSIAVTLPAASYGDANTLATALRTAIQSGLTAAGLPTSAIQVNVINGRLMLSSDLLPVLQVVNADPDDAANTTEFAKLGFFNGQRATTSPVPANGVLSAAATFDLTIGGVTHPISVAPDAGNQTVEDGVLMVETSVGKLATDVNTAIQGAFGTSLTYVTVTGDDVTGMRLVISDGDPNNQAFIGLNPTNDVARRELGFVNDSVSSKLAVRGESGLAFGPNASGDAIPADANFGAFSFDVKLFSGASSVQKTVSVPAGNFNVPTDDREAEARRLVTAINDALRSTVLDATTGQTLGSVLAAGAVPFFDGSNNITGWGIRLVQPAAYLDTALPYAIADRVEVSNVTGDHLGLSDAGSDRVGPTVGDPLSGTANFTINLIDSNGAATLRAISLTDTNASLPNVVDAINTKINEAGSPIAGKVVAGLDGSRLVLAVSSGNNTILTLTNVNATAAADLGLNEGMSGRSLSGIDAFVQDVNLRASIEADGAAQGSANFGFVGLNLGAATAELDAVVDMDLAVGESGALFIREIFEALQHATYLPDPGNPGQYLVNPVGILGVLDTSDPGPSALGLVDPNTSAEPNAATDGQEIDVYGSAKIRWEGADITIPGSGSIVTDLTNELGDAVGDPFIEVVIPNITNLNPATFVVDYDLGGIADAISNLANFSFDDAVAALRAIAGWLQDYVESLGILNDELPLLGISLADSLAFVEDFAQAVEDIAANPTANLQGLLARINEGLSEFPGAVASLGYAAASPGILTFGIAFQRQFSDNLPLNVDVVQLLTDAGVPLDALPDGALELSGQADLAAAFGIDASLKFGVDVDALSAALDEPVQVLGDIQDAIFLDADETYLELSAYAGAENVTFTGSLGPLGLFVTNGGAVLNDDGVFGNTDPATIRVGLPTTGVGADDRITLAEFIGNPDEIFNEDNVDFDVHLAADLPVYFPTSSNFIGSLAFSGFVTDPFDLANGVDFSLTSLPDFSQIDLSNLGILDTLNLFLAGADTVLGTLGDLINGQMFGGDGLEDLPLVGDALQDVGSFIDDLRNEVIPAITEIIDTAPELAAQIFEDVGQAIQDAINSLGTLLAGSTVTLNLIDGSDNVDVFAFDGSMTFDSSWVDKVLAARAFSFGLDLAVNLDISTPHADLGLDVFSLELDELTVGIDLALSFGIGVSLDDGFFFQVNKTGEEDLSAELTVHLPDSIKAQLFLLQLEAKDDPLTSTVNGLSGHFSVDVMDTDDIGDIGRIYFGDLGNLEFDVDYGIEADLDLLLELGLNDEMVGFGFPKIAADFEFHWSFGDDNGETTNPELTLGNLRLDIGSFIGETIGPFIRDVYDVIEPIDPILDILTDPIPVLSDLLGPTSLLDVAAEFGVVNPALVTALEMLDQLVDFAGTVAEGGNGYLTIMSESITFGGADLDLTDPTQVGGLIDPTKALNDVFAAFGATPPQEIADALDFITSGINQDSLNGALGGAAGGFSFPFLDNPEEILGLFFGRNMTLVAYDLPPLEFGFDFSIYVPIWGPLGARFAGGIGAIIDLAFGYDTQGFFSFANGGFENPIDLIDGFFVYDDNPFTGTPGIDVPEVTVTGEITAAAELNAVVASAGVGGGIFATIGFDLNDPDQDLRIRLDEILANLYLALEEGPLALFSVDALIEAKLFAYIEALFGLWRKEFQFGPSLPLYEEHFELEPDPVLATDLGDGTLRLNIGQYAEDRVYTTNGADDPTDVAETLEVEIVDADTIKVRGKGSDFNNAGGFLDWQTYNTDHAGGFTLILGHGGQEDDVVTITDPNNIKTKVELHGGAGNDVLTSAGGADLLKGDAGDDRLVAGAGDDKLDGGAGADCLQGGDGKDTLAGAAGGDTLMGQAGNDVMLGEAGDDVLAGGADNDTAQGGEGRDLVSGGAGADLLQGDAGIDRIWGDADFTFSGCDLVLDASADEPALVIPAIAQHGNDSISGGGGSDEVQGNGGNDLVYGDSSFKLNADFTLALVSGEPVLLLPLYGDFGADNLSGGAGADTVDGEAGNDVIRGDNTRVVSSSDDDNDPFSWFEGDRFHRGTAQTDGAADGNDVLEGGKGSDIVFGNAGDDNIAGGIDNDFLLGNAGHDTVTGALGADVIFGDNGSIVMYTAGNAVVGGTYNAPTQDLKQLKAESEAGDGDDWLDGGQDADILFGGAGVGSGGVEDEIRGGSADDIAYGDHGQIDFSYLLAARSSYATTLTSIDKGMGGNDLMFGSTGRDVLVGGKGDDTVNGDDALNPDDPDSRDIVAGDHVVMTQAVKVVKINGTLSDVLADVYVAFPDQVKSNETDPAQGGNDTLDGRQDDDFMIGGPGNDKGTGGLGHDVLLGDRGQIDFDSSFVDAANTAFVENFGKDDLYVLKTVQSTDLNAGTDIPFTGTDELSGGDGNDVVIGGGRGDKLFGDAELDGTVGTLTSDSDILLGDNGRVDYLQHGVLAKVRTTDVSDATGGNDTIEGNAGVDIAMGGVGSDAIHGDAAAPLAADGDDILMGDNGEVDFTRDLDANLAPTGASPANLATLDLIVSYTDGLGDADTISGNAGGDVAMGGTSGDVIYGDASTAAAGDARDILLGDNGRVELVDPTLDGGPDTGVDRMLVRGGAIALIRSTDEQDAIDDTGGSDSISGNAGGDILLGGVRGDRLWGDREVPTAATNTADGNDVILGDNGALEWLSTGRLGDLSFDPSDARWNSTLPTAFAARDVDLDTLDVVTTEQPNNGGRDIIYGGNGRDTAMGGTDADSIWGDTGDDALLSAGAVDTASNGNDLLFGDHGRVYAQLSLLTSINSRNFFAIDIEQGDGGDGDRIWGEEGMDILLGQQGDDRLWGGTDDDDLIGGHNVEGGADELLSTTIAIATGSSAWNDLIDGGSENDVLAGDNAIVWRTGDEISPRFRTLTGATLYTTTESTVAVNVDGTPRQDPDDTRGRFVFLLDHADGTAAGLFGNDVMAGGAHRDLMFGQLGDDLMQGDGLIDGTVPAGGVSVTLSVVDSVGAAPGETGGTHYFRVPEQVSDGDDAMEGNGGADVMLGGLGQDDMVGGSSALYGLTTPEMRPDGTDYMWGGAGIQTAHGDLGYVQGALDGSDPAGTAAETAIAAERGRDADHMLGDNGNIFRIVSLDNPQLAGGETTYRRYQYDSTAYTGGNWLVVRASEWLDYTLGGPDFDQNLVTSGVQTTQGQDNGAGDFMHGEAGNDHVHGMAGSDILFGNAHDDDIVGGYGHDWISGGTGQDGVIGDDGIIRTSRNSTAGETLFGVPGLLASDPNPKETNGNALNETIKTPGGIQVAVINKAGELAKAMDLTPLSVDALWGAVDDEFGYAGQSAQGGAPYADDIIYGGTGSDWLHGGSGDDGISGAEALPYFYTRAMLGLPSASTLGASSVNAGDQLRFNPEDTDGSGPNRQRAGEFALYDEYFPLEEIRVTNAAGWGIASDRVRPGTAGFATATPFFLNFDPNDGVQRASENVSTNGQNVIVTGTVNDDGDDRIFGGNGNDWLVGGTGRDNAYGGWGNDLVNMDDRHSTNGSLNDQPDTHSTFEDRAYGGAGRDVLVGNTGGDRLIDWVGEWNSYLVPFAPFGMATVSRTLQPQLPEFLYALSHADGADPTIVADGNGTALRNGEPFGELGLVLQKDPAWQDQTGAPADPQAGNIPGGKRDVLRSADFNNQQGQGFVPESGSWSISGGRYEVAPAAASGTTDAISLYFTGEPLPTYFEIAATINAIKPVGGIKANAYIIFDYASPTDFKFAGLNVSTNKIEIGQRASWGFQVLASINSQLKAGQDYNVLLSVNGSAVTFVVNGSQSVSYAFAPRVDALGISHPIRDGMYGLGGDNARALIDDVRLQILPPNYSYVVNDDFTAAGGLLTPATGSWTTSGGRLVGDPGAAGVIAMAGNPVAVGANSVLQLDAKLALSGASAIGGIVFDKYSDTDFKFAAISAQTGQVLIGHYTERSGWVIDRAVAVAGITAGTDYALGVSLKGSTVSVTLGGSTVLSHSYNSTVVDGAVGVLARGGSVSFDSFGLKTDDPDAGSATAGTGGTSDAGPAIDWSVWNSGVTAGSPLIGARADVLWQEQFVSRLAARSGTGGPNSSLYFQL